VNRVAEEVMDCFNVSERAGAKSKEPLLTEVSSERAKPQMFRDGGTGGKKRSIKRKGRWVLGVWVNRGCRNSTTAESLLGGLQEEKGSVALPDEKGGCQKEKRS